MSKFDFRQYEPGDEDAINDLYFSVTGKLRTREEYLWQWHEAPGGPGEIWLIEYISPEGEKKIIGHHGLMPLLFSFGSSVLLAGKTENTMVHPEFRRKILYPKYEKKFLSLYEKRFDLLFSTMGPPAASAALRQREAFGYSAKRKWLYYHWSLSPGAVFSFVGASFSRRKDNVFMKRVGRLLSLAGLSIHKLYRNQRNKKGRLALVALSPAEAEQHPFFTNFWDVAKSSYCITPRRNREDLQWRFWRNPYARCITFICKGDPEGEGYAIVRDLGNQIFRLEDIVCYPLSTSFLLKMLQSVCDWVAAHGGTVLSFVTTSDQFHLFDKLDDLSYANLENSWPLSWRKHKDQYMLRKITNRQDDCAYNNETPWYVTPFVFEGR